MPKEMYILLGAVVGSFASYVTAWITGRNQIRIAEIASNRDINLQAEKFLDSRIKSEVCLEREKLEKLHIILSTIEFENSLTMSNMQSSSNMTLNEFRSKYLENCSRLHEAHSIIDIYYSEMSDSVLSIYGQTNIFWGNQEGILRTDINEKYDTWMAHIDKVLDAGKEISKHVRKLQNQIIYRSKELNKELHRASQQPRL